MTKNAVTETPVPKSEAEAKRPADNWIWGIYILLCIVSLVESYSASSQEIGKYGLFMPIAKHAVLLLGGIGIAWAMQHVHYNKFKFWIPVFAVLTLVLVFYVMKYGDLINNARRSFTLFGVSVQPSEMAKLSLVTIIAWVMSKVQIPGGGVKWSGIIVCAVVVLVFGVALYPQGFTNTAILMGISLAMMLIGGVQFKRFLIVLAVYGMCYGAYKAYDRHNESREAVEASVMKVEKKVQAADDRSGTRQKRMANFDFSEDSCLKHPMTSEFQQEQYGYMARANGGVIGVMPGNSRECSRLPLAFSDYVFSIIVEELGLVGALLLMSLYLSLLGRAGYIAQRCKRAFPALLVMGIAVMITVQALSHMAINSGLVPVTGQPLPFISKGGSSIIIMSVAMGIMLSVSRFAEFNTGRKKTAAADAKPDAEGGAINPTQIEM
ncbi:MAG: FtsW/RodA/SpoVE family cell cycle protein [Muribaculaceae bacterium]